MPIECWVSAVTASPFLDVYARVRIRMKWEQVSPLSPGAEAGIRAWLEYIEETDPATIAGVLARCQSDAQARAYFLERSEELRKPDPWRVTHCGDRVHFERIDHLHLGHCAKGEPEATVGLWDTDRRYCEQYQTTGGE